MLVALRIATLALVLVAAATSLSFANGAASISGTVIDANSHKPVAGAKIEAFLGTNPTHGYPVAVGQTRKDGNFRLSGLQAGSYKLHVMKMGYSLQELSGLTLDDQEHLIVGEPVGLIAASADDMVKMACNSIVRPDQTGDVYVVCAGR